tara:strand:- start:116 stop:1072 length:957 start_codon:yes stop_codon:yes gene_type:complete
MKKILITGGFGILGTSLSTILYKKKYKIFLLDRSKKKRKVFKAFGSKIKIIKGDFKNLNQLKSIIKKIRVDTIIHLGASTQIMNSYKNPYDTFQTNIMGTINILEAVRTINKNINVIFSSTVKAYGKMINRSYKENTPLRGDLPDEVSKSAADLVAQSYAKTYDLKIGIFRSCNIYGPADFNMDRLIPGTILQALKGIPTKLRTSGKLKRDYLYVDDASIAYYKLMLHLKKNKKKKLFVYNLGSKYNLNSLEVVNSIYKIMKINLKPVILNNSSIEIVAQKIDFSKAKKELKWAPNTSFKEGILKTIKWYKEYYQGYV